MSNSKNLIPLGKGNRTKSEEREIMQKGGIKSGESRRNKKTMKDALTLLMSLPTQPANLQLLEKLGIDEKDATNQMLLLATIMKEGLGGNAKAWEFIRDTMGEKPTEKVEVLRPIDESVAELDAMLKKMDDDGKGKTAKTD